MASSNRHWPSMFKSKPCNSHHQRQQDINSSLISNGCQRTLYSSECEERSPEPKPRWNPRPEQIRILEAIFNSGMVNPPRDEIRKIRAQLQEFGQVGDANVFYWFQNRKSRSKHKQQRNLQNTKNSHHPTLTSRSPPITSNIISSSTLTLPSSSSSSSDILSSNNSAEMFFPTLSQKNVLDASTSPTASVNQPFLYTQNEVLAVPFSLPFSEGFCFQDAINVSNMVDNSMENCSSFVLGDFLLMGHDESSKKDADEKMMKMQQQQMSFTATTTAASCTNTTQATVCPTSITALSAVNHYQGAGNVCETEEMGPTKSTVFINDVAFEVTMAPFNVRYSFGDDALLVDSSGQPVLTNEWGITLEPLQHGAFYYVIRMLSTSADHHTTVDLV